MIAPKPQPCQLCFHLRRVPRGKRLTFMCGKSGVNAHAERANPNGCGPQGVGFTRGAPRAA